MVPNQMLDRFSLFGDRVKNAAGHLLLRPLRIAPPPSLVDDVQKPFGQALDNRVGLDHRLCQGAPVSVCGEPDPSGAQLRQKRLGQSFTEGRIKPDSGRLPLADQLLQRPLGIGIYQQIFERAGQKLDR